jgi:hypothetical protein
MYKINKFLKLKTAQKGVFVKVEPFPRPLPLHSVPTRFLEVSGLWLSPLHLFLFCQKIRISWGETEKRGSHWSRSLAQEMIYFKVGGIAMFI